ncbi:hypothetical protein V7S43_013131 [Phytophthora oleae]|uniref:Uncharacterized protein n=1 Tax=Phytophthora oleae TaxID=2107226 RepID=A0ABD3F7A0_9STRA
MAIKQQGSFPLRENLVRLVLKVSTKPLLRVAKTAVVVAKVHPADSNIDLKICTKIPLPKELRVVLLPGEDRLVTPGNKLVAHRTTLEKYYR